MEHSKKNSVIIIKLYVRIFSSSDTIVDLRRLPRFGLFLKKDTKLGIKTQYSYFGVDFFFTIDVDDDDRRLFFQA
jgi:hypothetical protein